LVFFFLLFILWKKKKNDSNFLHLIPIPF
jgi:hypothetical protein